MVFKIFYHAENKVNVQSFDTREEADKWFSENGKYARVLVDADYNELSGVGSEPWLGMCKDEAKKNKEPQSEPKTEEHKEDSTTTAPVAPVAPVAPTTPVAPEAPVVAPKKETPVAPASSSSGSASSAPAAQPAHTENYQFQGFALDKQKPIRELTACDVVMWKNIIVSASVFLTLQLIFLLLTRYQYTVGTLFGRILLFQVIASFVYVTAMKIINNTQSGSVISEEIQQTVHAAVQVALDSFKEKAVGALNYLFHLMSCQDLAASAEFAIGVYFFQLFAGYVSGITLLYIATLLGFTVPLAYSLKRVEINDAFVKVRAIVREQFAQLMSKIPKAKQQ